MSNSTDASRKEEILAMSRKSKQDEGMEYARLKGLSVGEYTFSAVGLVIALFSFFTVQYTTFWAMFSIIFATVFGHCIPIYRFTKKKYHLAWVVCSAVLSIVGLIAFVAVSQGWIEPATLGRWWGR